METTNWGKDREEQGKNAVRGRKKEKNHSERSAAVTPVIETEAV